MNRAADGEINGNSRCIIGGENRHMSRAVCRGDAGAETHGRIPSRPGAIGPHQRRSSNVKPAGNGDQRPTSSAAPPHAHAERFAVGIRLTARCTERS